MIYEGRVMWCIDLACRSVWMQTGNEDNDWAGNLYIGRWINEGEEPW